MRAVDAAALDDAMCVVACTADYFTLEPFVPTINYEYDPSFFS